MPKTEPVALSGTEHDRTVLAVGAAVLVGVLAMGGWVVHADAVAPPAHPNVTVVAPTATLAH